MSPTTKMVLFMVGATVSQLIVIGLIIVIFAVAGILISPANFAIFFFVGCIAALPISFIIYGKVMKRISPWLEKHIPQLFRRKR
jgi:hypothetical protein